MASSLVGGAEACLLHHFDHRPEGSARSTAELLEKHLGEHVVGPRQPTVFLDDTRSDRSSHSASSGYSIGS